jgi:DNA adenine methylase
MNSSRPIIRYHGGKWRIAPWIISHFPKHKFYCEPFGGAGSVLLQKSPVYGEIYNDLDGRIVNIFRVLQDPKKSEKLIRLLELTPYSRSEFKLSYEPTGSDVENARRTILRSFMGFSSDSATRKDITGFRAYNNDGHSYHTTAWKKYPYCLRRAIERLKSVTIEELPAIEVIDKYDHNEMLFYVDPPYLPEVRFIRPYGNYAVELTEQDHIILAEKLKQIEGMVFISGYDSELYKDIYAGWHSVKTQSQGQAGPGKHSKTNTEILWISPNAKDIPIQEKLIV